jgi:hypothetical protein
MKHERERERESLIQVTSTMPIVQGVNYSLFILLKEMVSKGKPGAPLTASPLLSLQSLD